MSIKQLTVFVPNKRGTMVGVTDILAKNNVNLRALSLAETEDFGILRLIVNDEKTAEAVLEQNGYFIKVIDVIGVKILPVSSRKRLEFLQTRTSMLNISMHLWLARKSTHTLF